MPPSNETRTHLMVVIIILSTFVLGCQYFQPPEHLQSEAATENPRPTLSDAPVFLNNQPTGKISDIGQRRKIDEVGLEPDSIETRIKDVMNARESNGVMLEGTNVYATNLFLIADPELQVGAFAKLYTAIDRVAGSVYIPRDPDPPSPETPERPNPLTIIVRTQPEVRDFERIPFNWPIHDPEFKLSYDIEVEIAKSADQLKSTRMWEDSFEISDDERFFINEKQGPDADYGPKYSRVKQRPVDEVQAKNELANLPTSSERKLLIVNEKASYGKLLSVLALVDEPRTRFRIVVLPTTRSE